MVLLGMVVCVCLCVCASVSGIITRWDLGLKEIFHIVFHEVSLVIMIQSHCQNVEVSHWFFLFSVL